MPLTRFHNLASLFILALFTLSGIGLAQVPTEPQSKMPSSLPKGIFIIQTNNDKPTHGDPGRIEFTGGKTVYRKGYSTYDTVEKGSLEVTPNGLRLKFFSSTSRTAKNSSPQVILKAKGSDLIDQDGNLWAPRQQVLKTPPAWTPVSIKVIDQNKKPLSRFQYTYTIESKEGNWDPLLVQPLWHDPDQNKLTIKAPAECVIHLHINHPKTIDGFNHQRQGRRQRGAEKIKINVQLGKTVRGKIIDHTSGKPLAGASIAPMVFTPPGFTPNRGKSVTTGTDGLFEIHGVDYSYSVKHPHFLQQQIYLKDPLQGTEPIKIKIVRLKPGVTLRGHVYDRVGQPIAGARVSSGNGKWAFSAEDGSFTMRGLAKWSDQWDFSLSKSGYNNTTLRLAKISPKGHRISMIKLPTFSGQVIMPDGTPATAYQIVCGPGSSPHSFACQRIKISDQQGRFHFQINELPETTTDKQKEPHCWLGIRTEGAAPWEGVLPVGQLSSGELKIRLQPGIKLTAKLKAPKQATAAYHITLTPLDRPEPDSVIASKAPGQSLASVDITGHDSKQLHIPHLRAGTYQIIIQSPDTTPHIQTVVIGEQNLDLGEITMRGTGTISGIVHQTHNSSEPWSFADGELHVQGLGESFSEPYRRFKADADGKFTIDQVPAGEVTLSFPYHVSADILTDIARSAYVLEGQNSEVRFQGENGLWAQAIQLTYEHQITQPDFKSQRIVDNVNDDDSLPALRFIALPHAQQAASYPVGSDWIELSTTKPAQPVIPDISAGKWTIKVYDWLGSRGFNDGLRAEVHINIEDKPSVSTRPPITIDLGSHLLSGKVTSSVDSRRHLRIIAIGKQSGRVFFSRCDSDGDFIIRFLPHDTYRMYAHDDDAGWCSLGQHQTKPLGQDLGEHKLVPGGHIDGQVADAHIGKRSLQIIANGPHGLTIPLDTLETNGSFHFGHLPPGQWTIEIHDHNTLLSRHSSVVIIGQTSEIKE